jgi:hypothetical protein
MLERVINACSDPDDRVLEPVLGAGTTAVVCKRLGRRCVGIEQKAEYVDVCRARIAGMPGSALRTSVVFCPGCAALGVTKVFSPEILHRSELLGKKITCTKCMKRYTLGEIK